MLCIPLLDPFSGDFHPREKSKESSTPTNIWKCSFHFCCLPHFNNHSSLPL
jgi:hypothetical protein